MGVLSRLANTVSQMTSRLDELAARGLQGWVEELAALHALQVQSQALLDMLLRIAAEMGYAPDSPGEAARIILEEGLISGEDYDFIRRLIGFRNVVVHAYMDVDMDLVRSIVGGREYRRVALLASRLLEAAMERGLDP